MRIAGLGLAAALGMLPPAAFAADPASSLSRTAARQCQAEGPGFYYVPGTDTCLRIGGYLWTESYYNSYTDYPRQNDRTYWVSTFGLQVDARTATDYGPLRSHMEARMIWRSADPWSDGPAGADFQPWDMHIEFAGFTFGYLQSFFDFYANADVLGTDPATIGDETQIGLVGYTWKLGNGFAAQVSLEDSSARDAGLLPASPASTDPEEPYGATARLPEIVATFGQSGAWGSFLLSGALHQIGAASTQEGLGHTTDDWGYAVQGGMMFNLPVIAKGDTLYLQAAYADGAVSYLGLIDASGDFSAPDAFVRADGGLSKVRGWSAVTQYLHNWNDRWNSAFFGGMGRFDIDDPVARAAYGASGVTNVNVGANLTWTPVAPLAVTLQYDYNLYRADDYRPTGNGLPVASQEAHEVLLMVAATF